MREKSRSHRALSLDQVDGAMYAKAVRSGKDASNGKNWLSKSPLSSEMWAVRLSGNDQWWESDEGFMST